MLQSKVNNLKVNDFTSSVLCSVEQQQTNKITRQKTKTENRKQELNWFADNRILQEMFASIKWQVNAPIDCLTKCCLKLK